MAVRRLLERTPLNQAFPLYRKWFGHERAEARPRKVVPPAGAGPATSPNMLITNDLSRPGTGYGSGTGASPQIKNTTDHKRGRPRPSDLTARPPVSRDRYTTSAPLPNKERADPSEKNILSLFRAIHACRNNTENYNCRPLPVLWIILSIQVVNIQNKQFFTYGTQKRYKWTVYFAGDANINLVKKMQLVIFMADLI